MEPSDLLRKAVEVLEELGVPYFVTGSTATIFYGEPRFTIDLDVVVHLRQDQVPDLVEKLTPEFYVDEESARLAISRRSMFNAVLSGTGFKIDFIVSAGRLFDLQRFARARRVRPEPDYEASFASPTDIILSKMLFYQQGGSDKHIRDIAGVFKVSGDEVEMEHLEKWVEKLGLEEVWAEVRKRLAESTGG